MLSPDNVIIREREIPGGTSVFPGTRVPFQALLECLEGGQTLDEFLDDPTLSREAARCAPKLDKTLLVSELG